MDPPRMRLEKLSSSSSALSDTANAILKQGILCARCEALLRKAWATKPDGKLSTKPQIRNHRGLEQSAKRGCDFCGSLLKIINPNNVSYYCPDLIRLWAGDIFGQIGIKKGSNGRHQSSPRHYDILIDIDHHDQAGFVGANSFSNASLAFILSMLNNCKATHPHCGEGEECPLPKRILFVGSKSNNIVKLVECAQERARYACLSHCWGKKESIKTTRQNINDHKIEIPWDGLPTMFSDAITFCRELEIQYIWIDSLCIIQDDEEDWAEESSKMASIFENSYICLAATSGPNHYSPCASQLAPQHHFQEIGRICQKDSSASFPILARRRLPHPDDKEPKLERVALGESNIKRRRKPAYPLLSRAWVYQELLLSPRTIHFLPNELMWECRTGVECECQDLVQSSHRSKSLVVRKQFDSSQTHNAEPCAECRKSRSWIELLGGYVGLNLTFAKDKLAAISGLARKMHEMRRDKGDRYLAGLWESELPHALFWWVTSSGHLPDRIPRHEPLIAPTWSWASVSGSYVDGQVKCSACSDTRNAQFPVRVESIDFRPATVNPYGPADITSTTLVISGVLSSGFLRYGKGRDGRHAYDFVNTEDGINFRISPDYDLRHPGPYHVPEGSALVCLYRDSAFISDYERVDALIFRGIGEEGSIKYERIASVSFYFEQAVEMKSKASIIAREGIITLI